MDFRVGFNSNFAVIWPFYTKFWPKYWFLIGAVWEFSLDGVQFKSGVQIMQIRYILLKILDVRARHPSPRQQRWFGPILDVEFRALEARSLKKNTFGIYEAYSLISYQKFFCWNSFSTLWCSFLIQASSEKNEWFSNLVEMKQEKVIYDIQN